MPYLDALTPCPSLILKKVSTGDEFEAHAGELYFGPRINNSQLRERDYQVMPVLNPNFPTLPLALTSTLPLALTLTPTPTLSLPGVLPLRVRRTLVGAAPVRGDRPSRIRRWTHHRQSPEG